MSADIGGETLGDDRYNGCPQITAGFVHVCVCTQLHLSDHPLKGGFIFKAIQPRLGNGSSKVTGCVVMTQKPAINEVYLFCCKEGK